MEPGSEARRLIVEAKGLILDFDGPMCDVFAGTPASAVAAEFRDHVGLTDFVSDDPLAVLDAVSHAGGDVDEAHRWLTAREVEVVEAAIETPGLRQLVEQFDGPVAVASNNAASAIVRWLDLNGVAPSVAHVEGRDPTTMKPHPCSYIYETSSARSPSGTFELAGTVSFDVGVVTNAPGPFGPYPSVDRTTVDDVEVQEIQALNR